MLGIAGIAISISAYVPQVVHLGRERCSAGVSTRAWAMWLVGGMLVTVVAVQRRDPVFIILQISGLASAGIILLLARRYRGMVCETHAHLVPAPGARHDRREQSLKATPEPAHAVVDRQVSDNGQVGVVVVLALLLTSAVVSLSIAAMTEKSAPPGTTPGLPTAEKAADPRDPENAEPFDGPKHQTYDAALESRTTEIKHNVTLEVTEGTFEVAEGMFMNLWTFGGKVPGPVVRVVQGDKVHFRLVNKGRAAHSIDFHAAEIAPNRAHIDVAPGESFEFDWKATQPGVFMYHCATQPVLHHIGNGMYGMVIVEPKSRKLPPAREYALVQSELYFGGQSEVGDLAKMLAKEPDWIVFNGYADQYVDEPLVADPGERVRIYLLNAGPSEWSAFHVIGAIFDRTWQEGVAGGPAQTISVAPSQGAIVDFTMEEDGLYPFVTHAFGDAAKGAIGTFKVGDGGPTSGGEHS